MRMQVVHLTFHTRHTFHSACECVQNASNASHLSFLHNILELGLSPEIPPLKSTDIWKSRIQTRTFSALKFHLQFSVLSTPRYCLSFVTVIHVKGSLNESRHPCHAWHTCHAYHACFTCKRKLCIAFVLWQMMSLRWLRLVGSLKLKVSCAEYYLLYRALLQKRLIILRSLPVVTASYASHLSYDKWCHMTNEVHNLRLHLSYDKWDA